jgi:hypothetical protein
MYIIHILLMLLTLSHTYANTTSTIESEWVAESDIASLCIEETKHEDSEVRIIKLLECINAYQISIALQTEHCHLAISLDTDIDSNCYSDINRPSKTGNW